MAHAELRQAARNEERQRESNRASMMETVVAGVVAGIEAQSQRTNTVSRSVANEMLRYKQDLLEASLVCWETYPPPKAKVLTQIL